MTAKKVTPVSKAAAQKANAAVARSEAAAAPAPADDKPFKVRATKDGYYDDERKREGAVFTVSGAQAFSKNWMEKVSARTPEGNKTGQQVLNENRAGTGSQNVFDDE